MNQRTRPVAPEDQAKLEQWITRGMMLDKRPPLASGKDRLAPPYANACDEETVREQSKNPRKILPCTWGAFTGVWQGLLQKQGLLFDPAPGAILTYSTEVLEISEEIFGPATADATREIQKILGVDPDGNCGPDTRKAYFLSYGLDLDAIPLDFVVASRGLDSEPGRITQWLGPDGETYLWPVGTWPIDAEI